MEMTLEEAFKDLISRRKWYANTSGSFQQAQKDKSRYLKGLYVPEERIRKYLSEAGWVQAQQEKWKKKDAF
jgi:hypothetical protein